MSDTMRGFIELAGAKASEYLIEQLEQAYSSRAFNTFTVIDEIKVLEGGQRPSMTKPPTSFTRGPLKGLWHKHFFDAQFMMKNIMNHWNLHNPTPEQCAQRYMEIMKEHGITDLSDENINRIIYHFVNGGYEQRAEKKKMTGEWLIFAKYKIKNYYLIIANHTQCHEQENELYQLIFDKCSDQFPFLFPNN